MADNTTLQPGQPSDTVRTEDRLGKGIKTEVVQLDVGGSSYSSESLVSPSNPLPNTDPYTLMLAKIAMQSILIAQAAQIGGFVPIDPSIAAVLDIQT